MTDITVIILTYNEEKHIERCIRSTQRVSAKIIVVDSFSTDRTVEISESLGAKVLQNEFVNQALQFQWALDSLQINTSWIMRLDADEYLEPSLIEEIKVKLPYLTKDINGVILKRKQHFLGRWIRYGDRYPIELLRIWRNGTGYVEQRWMDEHIVLKEGDSVRFENNFVDDNLNSIHWFIDKHNKYASREMVEVIILKYDLLNIDNSIKKADAGQAKLKRLIKEHIYNKLPIFVRPVSYFIYRYFLRLGFLDGKEGFAYHFMQGLWYRCLVDLKCLEVETAIKQHRSDKKYILEKLTSITGLKL